MSETDSAGDHPTDDRPAFDPPTDYRETPLPDELRRLLATAFGLDEEPATVGDWIAGFHRRLRATDRGPLGFDDLCHLDGDGRHVLRAAGEQWAFHCVFDAFIAPFLDDGPDLPVTVESVPPDGDATVVVEFDGDGVAVEPTDAVASIGAGRSLHDEENAGFDPQRAYGELCAHVNAFPDRDAYEAWTREGTGDAVTTAVPVRDAVGLARDLAVGPGSRTD